jgi:hypothetical protein
VLPVAALVRDHVPPDAALLTTHPHRRPSLDFYARRPIRPADAEGPDSPEEAGAYWIVTREEAERLVDRPRLGEASGQVLFGPQS